MQFVASALIDPYKQLERFKETSSFCTPICIIENSKEAQIVCFPLTGRSKDWIKKLSSGVIITWGVFRKVFLESFYPIRKYMDSMADIIDLE